MGWIIVDHTADAGFEAEASSWSELFALASEAFYSLCLEEFPSDDGESHRITLDAIDMEELAVSWINELLFLLENRRAVFHPSRICVTEEPCGLFAEGEISFSTQKRLPAKAATYGGLLVRKNPFPFLRMFLDL